MSKKHSIEEQYKVIVVMKLKMIEIGATSIQAVSMLLVHFTWIRIGLDLL